MMKLVASYAFAFLVTSCSIFAGASNVPDYVSEVHTLQNKVSSYVTEKYGYPMVGSGGAMMNEISMVDMYFQSPEFVDEKATISFLLDVSNKTIELSQSNTILNNASRGGTFSEELLHIKLFMGKSTDKEYSVAKLFRGKEIRFTQFPVEPAPAIHVKTIKLPIRDS